MERISLRDAFAGRENRFSLLDKGMAAAGFSHGDELLEIGCAGGEAAAHLSRLGWSRLTAADIDAQILIRARAAAPDCRFLCADARCLPLESGSFDGIFSEAAFSVIPEKESAVSEYARVLRRGGRFLLSDFCLRNEQETGLRRGLGVPMLEGVRTMAGYEALFSERGLRCVYRREEYTELLRIASCLCRAFGVKPGELGGYITSVYGADPFVSAFFRQGMMSFCQMVFEKGD